jgi:hypothetical protein
MMLPSSSCRCMLLHKYWTLSYVTWRIFHSDTFPQFIPSPCFCHIIHKIVIRFRHWSSWATLGTPASLIYKDECLFVCLYGTYTNPYFWTDLNQTLHTYPPWSGGGRRVCMDTIFKLSHLFDLFCWEQVPIHCAEVGFRCQSPPLLHYIRDAARVCVTSRMWRALWVMHRKHGEVNRIHVCENGNLMRREGSD